MKRSDTDLKKCWERYCEKNYVPIYLRSWWMDLVCKPEEWNVCLCLDGGGNVEGALVYYLGKSWGLPVISMPPLSTYSGLWFCYPESLKIPSSKFAFEKRVANSILKQLPNHYFFNQKWHPAITNWLPFYWHGFREMLRCTYRMELTGGFPLNRRAKRGIRYAHEILKIEEPKDPDILIRLYSMSQREKGRDNTLARSLFCKLDKALGTKNQRKYLAAKDADGNYHAAAYWIWDDKTTYSLLSGTNPKFRSSKAIYLLFWTALSENFGNSILFDFEGSMDEGTEEFLRSFGGTLTPYYQIFKARNGLTKLASVVLGRGLYG